MSVENFVRSHRFTINYLINDDIDGFNDKLHFMTPDAFEAEERTLAFCPGFCFGTLFNSAGEVTNFVYSLGKQNPSIIKEFNSLDRFKKKFELLTSQSIVPKWVGVGSRTFYNNLMMIDTCLPWILGECLLYYYSGKAHTIVEAEAMLRKENPLNFDITNQPKFYEYKLKQFLLAFALGMTAGTPWNGKLVANGGYIVVKEDGDIVCYHFLERNELEDYLFNNTYFDTPSTKRHGFGNIISSDKEDLLKLNLQVRFLS